MSADFITHGAALIENGYRIVPIRPGEKRPAIQNWQTFNLSPKAFPTFSKRFPDAGVGLLTGQGDYPLCAIDIDTTDPTLAAAMVGWCDQNIGSTIGRVGKPPKCLMVYRAAEAGWHKAASGWYEDVIDGCHRIEVLGKGQQFVAFHIHPDTGEPYHWAGDSPLNTTAAELPIINLDQIRQALEAFDRLALAAGLEPRVGSVASGVRSGDIDPESIPGPIGLTEAQAVELLVNVSPEGYDEWIRVGMALHHEFKGADAALTLWDSWSRPAKNYQGRADLAKRWKDFGKHTGRPVTMAWLLALVRQTRSPDDFEDLTADDPKPSRVQPLQARHLTTDLANAERIMRHFKSRIVVATDRWYAWTGTHWAQDDGEVYRCASKLSQIVKKEMDAWEKKKPADDEEAKINKAVVEALAKWSKRCEMRSTIDAALYIVKKLLTINEDALDANPWLLNCRNGTVDLRTGRIAEHDPDDYITRCIDIDYDSAVSGAEFEAVLAKVTMEQDLATRPVTSFLKRWFGYCATADTREHKFVVHFGTGRNGKSTILDTVADVLGDYAGTAAPGLLLSTGKDRHPTEIADLFGRRMVTAHESGEGGVLREDFVKQCTGGDRIKARFMRADFFEFSPTHKVQLLTNYKPVIKGQDVGIWARVLLVPYLTRFGTPEEVRAGIAHYVKDTSIAERLRGMRQGVLTWLVEGAVEWYRDGLNPPDYVLAASKDYQTEQDRVLQFVGECCRMGADLSAPLTGIFGGLYPSYSEWCKESGIHALGKHRFLAELERVVPYFRKRQEKQNIDRDNRRKITLIYGLELL